MTFRKAVSFCLALCIMATLGVAICGCDDLGAFEDTEEYYASFGDIVLLNEDSKEGYDVEEYFYNKETREPTKTVTSIWWKENGYSFFIESDYSLEELEPYIEEMTIIVVNRDK